MKRSLFFLAILLFGLECAATHLSGGEIHAERVNPTSLTFRITVRVFTNHITSNVLFGGEDDWLDFGDGSRIRIPETQSIVRYDLGVGVGVASYTVLHTYATPSAFRITYSEPNWEEGIINFDESVNTRFFLEATINALPDYTGSPKFLFEPFVSAVLGQPLSMAFTAKDTNDYKLRYALVTPKQSEDETVLNYRLPENATIHPTNGLFQWDTKFNGDYMRGTFLFCVKVSQYDSENRMVGSVIRNFIIRLDEEDISLPFMPPVQTDVNNAVVILEGEVQILRFAAGKDLTTTLQLRSELANVSGAMQYEEYDTLVNDEVIVGGEIVLNSLPEINRKNPYAIVLRVLVPHDGRHLFRDFTILFYTQDVAPDEPEEPITSISEGVLTKKFAYPNPVSSILYFDEWAMGQTARIVNMSGKIVAEKDKNASTVDVSDLAPGLYVVMPEKHATPQVIIKQ